MFFLLAKVPLTLEGGWGERAQQTILSSKQKTSVSSVWLVNVSLQWVGKTFTHKLISALFVDEQNKT